MLPDDIEQFCLRNRTHWPREDLPAILVALDHFKVNHSSPYAELVKLHTIQFTRDRKGENLPEVELLDLLDSENEIDESHISNHEYYYLADGQVPLNSGEGEALLYYDSIQDKVLFRFIGDPEGEDDKLISDSFYSFLREFLNGK